MVEKYSCKIDSLSIKRFVYIYIYRLCIHILYIALRHLQQWRDTYLCASCIFICESKYFRHAQLKYDRRSPKNKWKLNNSGQEIPNRWLVIDFPGSLRGPLVVLKGSGWSLMVLRGPWWVFRGLYGSLEVLGGP